MNIKILYMILLLAALSACSQKSEEADESVKSDAGLITPEKLSGLDVKTSEAKLGQLEFDLVTHANVSPAPGSLNIIAAPISGRILKIYKHEGERVAAGEALLEIESMEYTNLVYDYLMRLEESNWRKARAERLKKLSDKKINSQSEYEEAEALYKKTLATAEAAYSRLKTIGLSEKEIDALKIDRENTSSLKVRSQIGGVINEHLVELGKSVNIYDKLLTVVDTREVLIKAFLAPEDARFINPGDVITTATLRGNPDKMISGKIKSINPALDETNRSIVANAVVVTKGGFPLPGQNIRVVIKASTNGDAIFIPKNAIVYDGDRAVVFVKSGGNFTPREIVPGKETDSGVIVSEGLQPGEMVAVSELFTLKALIRFEEFAE